MTVPILRTTRLTLRDFREGDISAVAVSAADYEVSRWLVSVPYPFSLQDAKDFYAKNRAGGVGLLWMIIHGDALIGVISIGKELGYWLAPAAWGQGFMTEAAAIVVDYKFQTDDVSVMKSNYFIGNVGSKRVLQKLGFVDVGPGVQFSNARQANVPVRHMQLTRSDWDRLRTLAD